MSINRAHPRRLRTSTRRSGVVGGRDFVFGDEELIKEFERLEKKTGKRILKKGMAKAVRPVIQTARAKVRPISKTVAKALGIKRKSYQRGAIEIAAVGVRTDAKVTGVKTVINPVTGKTSIRKHVPYHTAHLIEGGTAPHVTHLPGRKVQVQHPGSPAQPFMEPALEQNETKAISTYAQVVREELRKHGGA